MFGGGAKTELCYYLIPVYNSVQCMVGIFAFSASPVLILTAVAANLAVTGRGLPPDPDVLPARASCSPR